MLLGEEFDTVISKWLYKKELTSRYPDSSKEPAIIKNIVELIRPKRNKGHAESVITFNFDSLLEMFLDKHLIKYKPIYNEDIKFNANEIPIYHIYGFFH